MPVSQAASSFHPCISHDNRIDLTPGYPFHDGKLFEVTTDTCSSNYACPRMTTHQCLPLLQAPQMRQSPQVKTPNSKVRQGVASPMLTLEKISFPSHLESVRCKQHIIGDDNVKFRRTELKSVHKVVCQDSKVPACERRAQCTSIGDSKRRL